MRQFIAPQVLKVNGEPSPCECRTEGKTEIVCEYCTQASLLLWGREEHAGEARTEKLRREIKELGIRRVAKNLGIRHQTVMGWVNGKRINPTRLPSVERVVATMGLVSSFQESAPQNPHK